MTPEELLAAAEARLRKALPVWVGAAREAALYSLNVGDRFELAYAAASKEMNEAFEDFTTKARNTAGVGRTMATALEEIQQDWKLACIKEALAAWNALGITKEGVTQ